MSKKLLSEASVRRFARLANLPVINENQPWGDNKDDDLKQTEPGGRGHRTGDKGYVNEQEDEFAEIEDEVDAELPPGEEVEMAPGEEEIVDMGDEVGMEADPESEALASDVLSAVAGALEATLGVDIEIEGAGEEAEMDMGGEEPEMDMDMDMGGEEVDIEDEEVMAEALRGIKYVPGKKEIINEVAKRVAKRLLKAKRAEQQLQEALGNAPKRKTPPRTKPPTARRKTRPVRNSRRRTKK